MNKRRVESINNTIGFAATPTFPSFLKKRSQIVNEKSNNIENTKGPLLCDKANDAIEIIIEKKFIIKQLSV